MPIDYTRESEDNNFRFLILQYYTNTIGYGAELTVWINSPKSVRRGNIDKHGREFRTNFLSLYKLTKFIDATVSEANVTMSIEKWISVPYWNIKDEKTKVKYFLEGIRLSDIWARLLIEHNIISF